MDFSLTDEQRAWQMKARKFAAEEIKQITLDRDRIENPVETFDWEIIKKGSKLGFRTAVVEKARGGHEIDFVTQALV
ncbi:MAG: acyl-CoA dehydrogenase family protein, partial [Alphaproteobacteria bacterium]